MSDGMLATLAQAGRTEVERRFEFASMPEGWWAVLGLAVAALALAGVFWAYRHEGRRGATPAVRTILSAIRSVVVLSLIVIWVQPVLATYIHRWIDSYTIVLIDDSSSMDLQDRYRSETDRARVAGVLGSADETVRRADILERILTTDDNALIRRLAERNRVKVFRFSDRPELIATVRSAGEESDQSDESNDDANSGDAASLADANRVTLPMVAQGPATDVSRAIRRSIESLGGAPLAGVVLLTDGGFNRGDPLQVTARYIEDRQIPLHAVGLGDASPPQNVRVVEVAAPENAFKEDPFSITAHLSTQGMTGETLRVELHETGDGAPETGVAVDTRTIRVAPDGGVEPVVFERSRNALGRAIYRVRAPVGPFESVSDDNEKQSAVNIIDDKMRVLLIAGGPSWEYRYLSRLLIRDETFDVSCWLQSAAVDAVRDGNTIIDHLPATAAELYEYDAVIMLDPDPAEFGPGWSRALESLVTDYGGGVLYQASRKMTSQFMRDPAVGAIVGMLPVSRDPEADLILNRIGHYQTRSWPVEVPPEVRGHPILRLESGGVNGDGSWSDFPGVFWHYPVLREKSVATVLLRHGNPQMRNSYGTHVLLATQFVGSGRTAFMAFDGSWRWRKVAERYYEQFWVHMLRYLVEGKLLGAKKRVTLLTDTDTFQLGAPVKVSARLFDPRFKPLELEQVQASWRHRADRQRFMLMRAENRPGWYEGSFAPVRTGNYEISMTLPGAGGSETVSVSHQIQVVRPNIEVQDPRLNREAILALVERSPQGRYYEIDELDALTDAIPDRHEVTTVKSRPTPLWDRWWSLAWLIGLLSVEWFIRKWVRLL